MTVNTLKGIGLIIEVQKTLGAAKTISAIAVNSAGEAVVSSTAHGFTNNDVVVMLNIAGMVQLNNVAARIKSVSTNAFTLELPGKDASTYTAFVSGQAKKVTSWDTVGWATALNMPGGSPTEFNTTTLADINLQSEYGMSSAGSGTIDGLDQIGDAAMLNLQAASDNLETRVFRLTYKTGQKRIFNGNVSAGGGFNQAVNDTGKIAPIPVTVRGFINAYSS